MRIDVHQHVWTEPLLAALAGRERVPFVRITPEGLTVLHSAGERPYVIDVQSETASERSSQLGRDGAKLALVAVMLGLAAVNRFRLMPRGDDRTIARNAALELGLGIIVLLLAGALGQLPPTL